MADKISLDEIPKLKVAELKKLLKERGLPVTGAKSELAERLTEALTTTDDVVELSEVTTTEQISVPVAKDTEKDQKEVKELETENEAPATITKVSAPLSEAERLKKRAERFGVSSIDAKKQARAERFGLPVNSTSTGAPSANVEVLKKRAERFGQVTSSSLSKVDEEERLRKRRERFGDVKTGDGEVKKIKLNELDDKKRKRAERFGLT